MFGRKHKTVTDEGAAAAPAADEQPDTTAAGEAGEEPEKDTDTAGEPDEAAQAADEPAEQDEESAEDSQETGEEGEDASGDQDVSESDESGEDEEDTDDEDVSGDDEDDETDEEDEEDQAEAVDWRADGPFDYDEVDLSGDTVQRLDLGALIVTPFNGLNLQLQVHQDTKQAGAVTAVWQKSGLEVALFAASAGSDLAAEFRDDVIEEAGQAGGTAALEDGPFGPQVHRVVPQEGPDGEQRFHVSRVWLVEGPRWLLRGTLLGPAAAGEVDNADSAPFVEFFRNLIVRRGAKPMVPGDPIPLDVPVGQEKE